MSSFETEAQSSDVRRTRINRVTLEQKRKRLWLAPRSLSKMKRTSAKMLWSIETDKVKVVFVLSKVMAFNPEKFIHQDQIAEITGIPRDRIDGIMQDVKKEIEARSGKTLQNIAGVGYRIAITEAAAFEEVVKSMNRGQAHAHNAIKILESKAYDFDDRQKMDPDLYEAAQKAKTTAIMQKHVMAMNVDLMKHFDKYREAMATGYEQTGQPEFS